MRESLRVQSLAAAAHQQVCSGDRIDAWASEVELALAPTRGRRLAALAETARHQALHTQTAWMETRRRRMEVETLHLAAERERRAQSDRKEQKDMDEWFLLGREPRLSRK